MSIQRFIHPSIWNSDHFNAIETPMAQLLFIGCFSTADDHGRRRASGSSLKGDIFPQRSDVTIEQVEEMRGRLANLGLIRVYSGPDGGLILDLPTWSTYQHPKYRKESVLPEYAPDRDRVRPISGPDREAGLGRVGLGRVGLGNKIRPLRATRSEAGATPRRIDLEPGAAEKIIAPIKRRED